MKKITIFIVCILIAITFIAYLCNEYKIKKSQIDTSNLEYKSTYQKEINGNSLATIINKALDNNEKNNVGKDSSGAYIENDDNSIKIDIKFKQSDHVFKMEDIYLNKVQEFIRLYGQALFKCTKIEYHNKTKLVKYLYFQEI